MSTKAHTPRPKHDDTTLRALRALRRSARRAREIARMYGTPIYVMKDGKIVALKP
jgi:hypothetical protein